MISSASKMKSKQTFNHWNISDMDENRHNYTYELDVYGQIVAVYEHFMDPIHGRNDTFRTTYEYDDSGNLVKIIDSVGNEFVFEYNSLGQKTGMRDPDIGAWTYSYDNAGNLVSQTGGGGNSLLRNSSGSDGPAPEKSRRAIHPVHFGRM